MRRGLAARLARLDGAQGVRFVHGSSAWRVSASSPREPVEAVHRGGGHSAGTLGLPVPPQHRGGEAGGARDERFRVRGIAQAGLEQLAHGEPRQVSATAVPSAVRRTARSGQD